MDELVSFFTFQTHSLFLPLRYLYPECEVLIAGEEQLSPLFCLWKGHCHKNNSCAEKLAKRVNFIFQHVAPDAKMMYAYFKYRDRPGSVRAGVFTRELDEPYVMTLNRSGFNKFRREGIAQQWKPPMEYWLIGGSDKLIPVENLLVKV